MLPLNLQFFAEGEGGEKTEPATQKKLDDARKEGQVAKSKEVANAFGIMALFLILKFWIGTVGTKFLETFNSVYITIPSICKLFGGTSTGNDIYIVLRRNMLNLMIILLPILLIGFLIAFVSDVIQVGWKPTSKPLQPKLNRLSPINGFKRIFSVNSLIELLKSIAKLVIIGYVAYSYLTGRAAEIFILYDLPLLQAVSLIGETVVSLGIRTAAVYMILAAIDFGYQKFKFSKDMRMTKQEVKEEYKNQEGNPEIKGKIRQRMREASQRRMMQSIPQADVVITNPTHFAVAIRYDAEEAPAPVVLAKGADYLAQKIKEEARSYNIEIVEDKPLARMLYANVEVGEQVPPELYQAVAEVLAFVYQAKGKIS